MRVAPRVAAPETARKKTTFSVYLATVIAIIITATIMGASRHSGADPFTAFQAVQLTTFPTIGYLIARGPVRSGARPDQQLLSPTQPLLSAGFPSA